jgi:hypothetical protein
VDCGSCTAPQTCGGGGATPGLCSGTLGCIKLTTADCASRNIQCGPMADGCGGTVETICEQGAGFARDLLDAEDEESRMEG